MQLGFVEHRSTKLRFLPPFPTNVHLILVLYPSSFNLTSVDVGDEQMGEVEMHNGVGDNGDVEGEDIVNKEIRETNTR